MENIDKIPSRTELNKNLYNSYENQSYDKFDINSNQEVLKNDARKIDVNQIREILDKKYRDNAPKRKSIEIVEPEVQDLERESTKEYDLNAILNKAKSDTDYDYDRNKLNKSVDASKLVDEIKNKYPEKEETAEEKELKDLIHTIAQFEIKNSKKDADLLGLSETSSYEKDEIVPEEDFYTGNLKISEKDFDDFKDIEKDIKSNNILVKILIFIFIIVAIGIGIFVANNYFNLGLF